MENNEDKTFKYTDQRFADIQMLRFRVPHFETLPLRTKLLVYWLSEAALYGRDILWDQNGKFNLLVRRTLETIYTTFTGNRESDDFKAFEVYLKRVWFSNGIHHHYAYNKFVPEFSESFFREALRQCDTSSLPLEGRTSVAELEKTLVPVIFDPTYLPKRVNQADGEDLLQTSASNYYDESVTQAEAEEFYARQKAEHPTPHPVMYGLNSRLERGADGSLYENTWKTGSMYGKAIDRITEMLEHAIQYAENEKQVAVINSLVDFYRSGDLHDFDRYCILWVQCTGTLVDFTNGFTEVYGDPLGLKASWEGYVNLTDTENTFRTKVLSQNAQWFEDHSPVDARFKKEECRGVSALVVNAAILGGDLYPSSAIGINLPNSNWIRQEYGSKSVTIGNLTHAYDEAARGNGFRDEFVIDRQTISMMDKYAEMCDNLHTDLHECLGHGSGRLLPGTDPDALKAYGSTIEEARADLFGLYYLADGKLVSLGLLPDAEAYKAQYYSYMMNGLLTQCVRIEEGGQIEEAHMRNRALIANWTLSHYPEAVAITEKDGKHYVEVKSYPTLREAFGTLLAEIQRVKSEGDYEAARHLVETYGVKLDPSLHREIKERYAALHLAPYKGFINPVYTLVKNGEGEPVDVSVSYTEAYEHQMLRYSREYNTLQQ